MCVGNRPLLRVGPFIIARRYIYRQTKQGATVFRTGQEWLSTWDAINCSASSTAATTSSAMLWTRCSDRGRPGKQSGGIRPSSGRQATRCVRPAYRVRCHHRRGNAVTLDLPICRARRFSVGFSIGRHRRRGWVRAPSPCALSHPARPAPAMHRRSRVHGLAESVWVHQHACVEGAIPLRSYVPLTGPSIVASRPSSARTWANFCGSM
jgi:hypothetical protein